MKNNNTKSEEKQVVAITNDIVMPAVTIQQAKDAWKQYQELKTAVIDRDVDIQIIEGKEFLKKSYWRKIATFFNLSVEVVKEEREILPNEDFAYHFVCKSIAPNGRFSEGAGSASAYEKAQRKDGKWMIWNKKTSSWYEAKPNSVHNVRSTAETRSFNRAVSNLVGGGEVSAEEVASETGEENGKSLATQKVGNGKCPGCGTTGKYHRKDCPNQLVKPPVVSDEALQAGAFSFDPNEAEEAIAGTRRRQ